MGPPTARSRGGWLLARLCWACPSYTAYHAGNHFPAQTCCLPSMPPPPTLHLGLPELSPPSPSLAPRPWGSSRSSRGQNTISFNKLNLLRLLITSGVGSDQNQKEEASAPGGSCGGRREGGIHVGGVQSLPGPGDPSHSNRNSGQVSILLDKNREGVYPPLPLAQQATPLPQERARVLQH